jgi:xanthine dehydrogenase accessory factor
MLDLDALARAVGRHGRVARVVIADHAGSSPREAGAAMLVWVDLTQEGGQAGTIGGGALEWQAARQARAMLAGGGVARVDRIPLGPALGQCCGGAVTLVTEVFDAATLPRPEHGLFARSLDASAMPLAMRRRIDRARAQGDLGGPTLTQGWFVEPVAHPRRQVWLWGAGHVGRAIAATLAPLPDLALTWVDTGADRFPDAPPAGVTILPAAEPARLAPHAPPEAEHLILTYSHELDLQLCHALLTHGFARCGLIGSATKWARFRSRLQALGHAPQAIGRIDCPIGDPALGKHPQAIAIGVAAALLRGKPQAARQENAG